MRTSAAAVALFGLTLASNALAIDDPYMWGFGPRVGTIVVPGKYPITFPDKVDNYNLREQGTLASCDEASTGTNGVGDPLCENSRRDVDENGVPKYHTLQRVGADINLGGDFEFYIDQRWRVGALAYGGYGKRWYDIAVMPKVDNILLEDQIDVYAGVGIGFGYQKFSGSTSTEALKVPYFPLRGEIGAMARFDTVALQLGVYVQSSIPGNQTYVEADGQVWENVGTLLSPVSYLHAGIEFTTMFGDFTPPKKKKGGKKGGGKKGGGKK